MISGRASEPNAAAKAQRLINSGQARAAVSLCQRSLKAPGGARDARLLGVYASALAGINEWGEAGKQFKKALRLAPKSPELHCRMGAMLLSRAQHEDALDRFDRALEAHPGHPWALRGKAEAMQAMGDNAGAAAALESALGGAGPDPNVAVALARVYPKLGRHEKALALIDRLLRMEGLQDQARISTLYARAQALAGLQRYDEAFDAYERANGAAGAVHDRHAHAQEIDATIEAWSAEAIAALPSSSRKSDHLVFIVGMPRSGTSLVEQILASHPRVFGAGELPHVADIVSQFRGDLGGAAGVLTDLSPLTPVNVDNASAHYLEQVSRLAPGADRVTDKMPNNFLSLGLISVLFPGCRVIHCVRDARDTCLSCYFNHFSGLRNRFTYDLEDLGAYYSDYWRLMEHWKATLETPILDVVYEELIEDQEAQSRRLVEHAGLEWDEACLRFHETKRSTRTLSADQVNRPIYRSSKARWRPYEQRLGPLLGFLPEDALIGSNTEHGGAS